MTMRGSVSIKDRIFAILPYAYPMVEAAGLGIFLIAQFPSIALLLLPLAPFAFVYGLLGMVAGRYASMIIFFALYVLVVRNDKINGFIRFNTMQALLIGITASLVGILFSLLGLSTGDLLGINSPFTLLTSTIFSMIFIGVMASSIYSIVFAVRGRYGEIPVVSEAAYSQVRY
ncbi:Tic20 family protein [Leptolyngbyaceae cyanobacterium UHCC 1019]